MSEDKEAGNQDALSKKTEVIEILFERIWPKDAPRPSKPLVVTNDEIVSAINFAQLESSRQETLKHE